MNLKKEPLLKFFFISITIYLVYGLFGVADEELINKDNTVIISANEINTMAMGWQLRYNREPTNEELQKLIDIRVKESVLYKEAIKMGLDKGDVVIKRRVVLQYRNLIKGLIVPVQPNEEQLENYYKQHAENYLSDDVISFTQIFFDPDKREDSTLDDANKTLKELQNRTTLPKNYDAYGDRFMLTNVYTDITTFEMQKAFGSGFIKSVLALDTNIWVGPILSGYGTHLVYINQRKKSEIKPLEEIKEIVISDYLFDKKEELVAIYLKKTTDQYSVIIMDENNTKQ